MKPRAVDLVSQGYLVEHDRNEDRTARVDWTRAELEALLDCESEPAAVRRTSKEQERYPTRPGLRESGEGRLAPVCPEPAQPLGSTLGEPKTTFFGVRYAFSDAAMAAVASGDRDLELWRGVPGPRLQYVAAKREIELLAMVRSRRLLNVVSLRCEDCVEVTVERVHGSTLYDWLSAGRLPLGTVLALAVEILEALAVIHRTGASDGRRLAHRDLRPRNIVIDAAGSVIVRNFGLRRVFAVMATSDEAIELARYSSPEELVNLSASPASDLFSLGVILWEALAGTRAFTGKTRADLMFEVSSRALPRLADVAPGVPAEVSNLCARLLHKEPARRGRCADEVLRDVRAIVARLRIPTASSAQLATVTRRLGVTSKEPPLVESPVGSRGRPRRSTRAFIFAVALVILAAALSVGLTHSSRMLGAARALRASIHSGR